MVLLGCVKAINEYDIEVSLPNNLTGFLAITEVSDTLAPVLANSLKDEVVSPLLLVCVYLMARM